jgi:carbonic anhydrase
MARSRKNVRSRRKTYTGSLKCNKCKCRHHMKGGLNLIPTNAPNIESFSTHLLADETTQSQMIAHDAKAIVLSCMDFRDIDDLTFLFNKLKYNNNYDQFILAGASFGILTKDDNWTSSNKSISLIPALGTNLDVSATITEDYLQKSFFLHVILAVMLHNITEIIIIDHMDCGACKAILKSLLDKVDITQQEEYEYHIKSLQYIVNNKKAFLEKIAAMVAAESIKEKIRKLQMRVFLTDLKDNYIEIHLSPSTV